MRILFALVSCSFLFGESPRLREAPDLNVVGWTALLTGKDMKGWTSRDGKPHTWFAAETGPGPMIVNGEGRTADLLTTSKFGDVELYLEFRIPAKSNSGVYLQGLYEVQILDSFGVAVPGVHDCGAIYEQWINGKGVGGAAPKRNASRAPGEWQSFQILFRAPRFEATGKKIEHARFLRVLHNGVVVHENVDVPGPTRASLESPEAPQGPLMIQGDHGQVALRNVYVRHLK